MGMHGQAQNVSEAEKQRLTQENEAKQRKETKDMYERMRIMRELYIKRWGNPRWVAIEEKDRQEIERLINEANPQPPQGNALTVGGTVGNYAETMLKSGIAYNLEGSKPPLTLRISNEGVYEVHGKGLTFEKRWTTIVDAIASQGFGTVWVNWKQGATVSYAEVLQMIEICNERGVAIEFPQNFKDYLQRFDSMQVKVDGQQISGYDAIMRKQTENQTNANRNQLLENLGMDVAKKQANAIQEKKIIQLDQAPTEDQKKNLVEGGIIVHKKGDATHAAIFKENGKIRSVKLTEDPGELYPNGTDQTALDAAKEKREKIYKEVFKDTLYEIVTSKGPLSPENCEPGKLYVYVLPKGNDNILACATKVGDKLVSVQMSLADKDRKSIIVAINGGNPLTPALLQKIKDQHPPANLASLQAEVQNINSRTEAASKLITECEATFQSLKTIIEDPQKLETVESGSKKSKRLTKDLEPEAYQTILDKNKREATGNPNQREMLIQKLTTEIADLEDRKTGLSKQVTDASSHYDSSTIQKNDPRAKTAEELGELKKKCDELETKIDALKGKKDDLVKLKDELADLAKPEMISQKHQAYVDDHRQRSNKR